MRVVSSILFAGFVVSLAGTAKVSVDQTRDIELVQALQQEEQMQVKVDRIVTGKTISKEHMQRWEAQRKLYLECPECVASQPYPED